jgi:hypothetical protein
LDFGGAKTKPCHFRAGALRPTTRRHESCSGRPQSAIIGKPTTYFRVRPRQNSKEILYHHVHAHGVAGLRTAVNVVDEHLSFRPIRFRASTSTLSAWQARGSPVVEASGDKPADNVSAEPTC